MGSDEGGVAGCGWLGTVAVSAGDELGGYDPPMRVPPVNL